LSRKAHIGIAFLGGGSGGHIYPSLAVADAIAGLVPDARAVFLTGDRPADEQALANELAFDEPARRIALHARPPSARPIAMLRCVRAWGQAVRDAREALRDLKDASERVVAMSTGGYVSAPAAMAARAERVPLVLVSLDARIGKANRFVGRLAAHTLVGQDHAPSGWRAVGTIIGTRAIAPGPKADCRRVLGLEADQPTLLVMGGSQGATSINALVQALCTREAESLRAWQAIHLAGSQSAASDLQAAYDDAGVAARVLERLSPMGPAWGAADLALCRGGAGSVAEAHANAVPAVFLPYPYHRDQHQAANAQPLVDAGGAVVLEDRISPEANFTAVAPTLLDLMASADKRQAMADALRRAPRQDGAAECARIVVDAAVPC
jgi:UDP-N-acetylglucosamine--N-acetylmuramyl-(pentapeptide) pyrophosphoryl-undecaprenol N-acetylglucosamine transferase